MSATTTTTATTTGPRWIPAAAGDSHTATGRRAVLFLLQAGQYASWQLDDQTIDMAAEACSVLASQARRDDPGTVEALADLQGYLRSIARGRAVAAAIAAEAARDAMPAATGDASPAAGAGDAPRGGGGGARVPRRPRPTGGAPSTGLQLPTLPAATLPPVIPVAPLAASDDLF